MKDLYKVLGVAEGVDDDAIKKAFRKLAKENHPDATGGDKRKTERFKDINEAYSILGDKQKRAEYDRLRHAPMRPDGIPEGFDPDTFAQVFGGGRGFGQGGVHVSMNGDDMGDIFASLFGGGAGPFGRGRGRAPIRGQDMVGTIEISFREAALGTPRTIRTGSGGTVEVQIPPGVESGGRLRLAGQGGSAPKGGKPGDLHLEIQVQPDPFLRRKDRDVELHLPLTVWEAILGTQVNVPTVEGNVRLTVPPGTSSGARLRLRAKGIKLPDGSRGDQLCRVEIIAPKLAPGDTEGRRLVEELAKHTGGAPVRKF